MWHTLPEMERWLCPGLQTAYKDIELGDISGFDTFTFLLIPQSLGCLAEHTLCPLCLQATLCQLKTTSSYRQFISSYLLGMDHQPTSKTCLISPDKNCEHET